MFNFPQMILGYILLCVTLSVLCECCWLSCRLNMMWSVALPVSLCLGTDQQWYLLVQLCLLKQSCHAVLCNVLEGSIYSLSLDGHVRVIQPFGEGFGDSVWGKGGIISVTGLIDIMHCNGLDTLKSSSNMCRSSVLLFPIITINGQWGSMCHSWIKET